MNGNSDRSRRFGGYSLIELLVVLVLLGIMASLAAPSMRGVIQVERAEGAAENLASDLTYARTLAVRSGWQTCLVFTSASSYSIGRWNLATSVCDSPVRNVDLASDFLGVAVTGPLSPTVFNSRGLVQQGDGWFSVVRDGHTRSIFLGPIGQVQREY